jgi:hypothetical protein
MERAANEAIQIAINISEQNSSGRHELWNLMRCVNRGGKNGSELSLKLTVGGIFC